MTAKIKDWNKFQHYKNRRPPWIRLYRDILDDPDFYEMSGDDFKLLAMLWLIASEDPDMEGKLPASKKLAFRLRISEEKLTKSLNRLNHWIISDASNTLADCLQHAIPDQIRSETDQSTDTDKKPPIPPKGFDEFWKAYPKKTGKQAALRAWKRAMKKECREVVIAAVETQKKWPQWTKDNGQYIPNPATWLNQGRWEDEVDLSKPQLLSFSNEKFTAAEQKQQRQERIIKETAEKLKRGIYEL